MSITYNVSVSIRDAATGLEVFGSPLTYALKADETSGQALYNEPAVAGGTYVVVTPAQLSNILTLLCVTSDKELTWRLNGQTNGGIKLGKNGILLIVNGVIDAGVATNAKVNNNTGETAAVRILAAGKDA